MAAAGDDGIRSNFSGRWTAKRHCVNVCVRVWVYILASASAVTGKTNEATRTVISARAHAVPRAPEDSSPGTISNSQFVHARGSLTASFPLFVRDVSSPHNNMIYIYIYINVISDPENGHCYSNANTVNTFTISIYIYIICIYTTLAWYLWRKATRRTHSIRKIMAFFFHCSSSLYSRRACVSYVYSSRAYSIPRRKQTSQ